MNSQTQPTPDLSDLWTMAYQIQSTLGVLLPNDAFAEMDKDHLAGTIWSAKDIAGRLKSELSNLQQSELKVSADVPTTPSNSDQAQPDKEKFTSIPSGYHPDSTLPEDLFITPVQALSKINTDFLDSQNKRIESLVWLLLSISQEGSQVDLDIRDLRSVLSQIVTMTTQVRMMFDHCRDAEGGKMNPNDSGAPEGEPVAHKGVVLS